MTVDRAVRDPAGLTGARRQPRGDAMRADGHVAEHDLPARLGDRAYAALARRSTRGLGALRELVDRAGGRARPVTSWPAIGSIDRRASPRRRSVAERRAATASRDRQLRRARRLRSRSTSAVPATIARGDSAQWSSTIRARRLGGGAVARVDRARTRRACPTSSSARPPARARCRTRPPGRRARRPPARRATRRGSGRRRVGGRPASRATRHRRGAGGARRRCRVDRGASSTAVARGCRPSTRPSRSRGAFTSTSATSRSDDVGVGAQIVEPGAAIVGARERDPMRARRGDRRGARDRGGRPRYCAMPARPAHHARVASARRATPSARATSRRAIVDQLGVVELRRRVGIATTAEDAAQQHLPCRRAIGPHRRLEHHAEHAQILALRDEEAEAVARARRPRVAG